MPLHFSGRHVGGCEFIMVAFDPAKAAVHNALLRIVWEIIPPGNIQKPFEPFEAVGSSIKPNIATTFLNAKLAFS